MREGRPVLLAQYLAAVIAGSVVIQIAFYGPIGLAVLVPAAPGILALAAYPRPRLLLERGAPAVRWRLVVVLSVLTTALLAAWAIHLISANAASLGSRELQWGTEVQHVFVLGVAALAISSRRPGWEVLAVLVGAAGIFLWAAALTVPSQPGNWGTTVGILAFVVGLAFLSLVIVPRLMGGRRRPYAP
jgi:hypothetical protein